LKKCKKVKEMKIHTDFQTGVQKILVENCWLTTELVFLGGQIDVWLGVKVVLRDCLAKSKNAFSRGHN
jgi:hypothetical protein